MNFKTLFVITIVLGLSLNAISQKDSTDFIKNNIYAEFGGIGGYGSINYERLIDKKSYFKVFGRIGLSTYNLKDYQNNFNPDIIVPLAMNACLGNEHNLELGLGPTFSRIVKVQENQCWLSISKRIRRCFDQMWVHTGTRKQQYRLRHMASLGRCFNWICFLI